MKQSIENVLIAGVGGQGVLLVSEILAEVCMAMGFDVKKSEVHGMAQRGGSVVSHVRYGAVIHSPLIEKGTADVLVAFEELEALRWSQYLKPDGMIIVNRQEILPLPVAVGLQKYPREIISRLRKRAAQVVAIDGSLIAQQVGSIRAVNIALLGALTAFLGLDSTRIRRLLRAKLPPRTLKANLDAFTKGWRLLTEELKPRSQNI